ncbi:MAG: hypothetical protein IJI57_04790 [Flexilinea sp.]|nr:hypothetical protein [Flexilinea sp.]
MMRKTKKQLGKMLADKFVENAEFSNRLIAGAIAEEYVTIGTVEELDRMRGYISAMEDAADLLGTPYLYKKLLVYKPQFEVYFNILSELYQKQKIIFNPGTQKANNFKEVEQHVKDQVHGR